jgi:hypothetical protein
VSHLTQFFPENGRKQARDKEKLHTTCYTHYVLSLLPENKANGRKVICITLKIRNIACFTYRSLKVSTLYLLLEDGDRAKSRLSDFWEHNQDRAYSLVEPLKDKGKAIPVTGHEGPQGCETSRLPHFLNYRLTDGGEVVSLTRRPPFTRKKIPGTHFCWSLSRPQGHSAAGRIMSIENSNHLIGNRTRDLPACSTVPQPTTIPRAPRVQQLQRFKESHYIAKPVKRFQIMQTDTLNIIYFHGLLTVLSRKKRWN